MKATWLETVKKTFPDVHASGFPAYPLLGSELSSEEARVVPKPWKLRLALCEEIESDLWEGLLEDVQELRLSFDAGIDERLLVGIDVYREDGAGSGDWMLVRRETSEIPHWPSEQAVWRREESTLLEHSITLDGMFLRNLSLLRNTIDEHPEVDRWVAHSAVSASGETEGLIADTIAYWAAAVGGAQVLEIRQQPGESFDTLWARLNICRLLRWESDLGEPGDALTGAGFFTELAQNLSVGVGSDR